MIVKMTHKNIIIVLIFMCPILLFVGIFFGPHIDEYGYQLNSTKTAISSINNALNLFNIDNGRFPTEEEGLLSLVEKPNNSDLPNWIQYMRKVPKDRWGNDYKYGISQLNTKMLVYSIGPNKIDDHGKADDVYLGKTKYNCSDFGDCVSIQHRLARYCELASLFGFVLLIVYFFYVYQKVSDTRYYTNTKVISRSKLTKSCKGPTSVPAFLWRLRLCHKKAGTEVGH